MSTHDPNHPLWPYKARIPGPLYWLYRGMRTAAVAFCFAGFWTGCLLVGWLWLPWLVLWPGTSAAKMGRALRAVHWGFRFFHFTMHTLRLYHRKTPFKVLRPNGIPSDTAAVLVANHPTLCDTTSIVSLFPNVVAVAQPAYAAHPLLKRVVRMCGFVPVGIHMIKECEERLRTGFDVLIFPEGTRSPYGGGIQPFHRGAFELAARAKVPVVLLKLTCTPPALSKRLPIWKYSDRMAVLTIEAVEMIHPADSGVDSRTWARTIEQRYREMLGYSASASELQSVGGVP
ncbi:MAG: 1-acyl-sn-glycerol-3-phosphate acyltransferase [Deltaproteobacteria bacterium]|nr:1-acyl-sn-glycerol-3-phosphate acyltransferase [Deltaproteobacteria bacterium]